jgi:hypothetical protein
MTVDIQINDVFGAPVPGCVVEVALEPDAGTLAFCTCCPNPVVVTTDTVGFASALFRQIGGRGSLTVDVDAFWGAGVFAIATLTLDFTSPDLDASCDLVPASATNVFDLGIWAGCLPPAPYCQWSDYNCDGAVNVIDLGVFAGGLGLSCGMVACP